jgi:hypothetical protein
MFDKITIRATVSDDECVHLARLYKLHTWVNEAGTLVEYRSSEYAKFKGIEVNIKKNKLTLKTSLHKFWYNENYGKLRNDSLFTVSEAKSAFEMLLFVNGLVPGKVRIIQFEIGLNLNVNYDPLTFIEQVRYVSLKDKNMFVDANFQKDRQRTTMKHKHIRKYFKIYDKTWEMFDKRKDGGEMSEQKILRVESVFRRHNEKADSFFSSQNVNRLVTRFYTDWKDLFFFRSVRAEMGTRKSEIDRATEIANEGLDEYLERARKDFESKRLTQKQYRVIREFARDFELSGDKYEIVVSPQEREYKRLIYNTFEEAKK